MKEVVAWLERRNDIPVCRMGYRKVLSDPAFAAKTLREFLELDLNVEAMASQVDPTLYRNRKP
jgi:hypothetical protein